LKDHNFKPTTTLADDDYITGMINPSMLGSMKKRIHLYLNVSSTKILRIFDSNTGKTVLQCAGCNFVDNGLGRQMIAHLFTRDRYIPGSCYRQCGLLQAVDGITEEQFDKENVPVVTYK